MPAASVCSHTTSPYHTIGGEQTASAAQNRMTTAWFSDTMISKTNQTFKKIPQRLQYGRSTCGVDVALASLDKRTGHGESNVSHSNEYGYVQDSWHHVRQTAQLAEHAIVRD